MRFFTAFKVKATLLVRQLFLFASLDVTRGVRSVIRNTKKARC